MNIEHTTTHSQIAHFYFWKALIKGLKIANFGKILKMSN